MVRSAAGTRECPQEEKTGEKERESMKVIHSIDVVRLEEILLEGIEQRDHGGLLHPLLVLVPTRQLVTYLKHRILDRTEAVLGVHILTHRELAVRALESALRMPPQTLDEVGLAVLLEDVLGGVGEAEVGPDWQYLREFAGARASVLSTFNDLREAGVTPEELARASSAGRSVPCAPLYARYVEVLRDLLGPPSDSAASGRTDRAGLIQAALPHVPGYLRRKKICTAFHHGAYELIGVHLELLRRVDSVAETVFLLPSEVEGPAFGYGSRCAAILCREGASSSGAPQTDGRAEWMDRLRLLYDPAATLSPRDPAALPRLEIWSTQGAEAELRVAALRAVALHERDGIALEEIAIVARSLDSYSPYLETAFGALELPFTSSSSSPLAREPEVAAFLLLLRVLAGNLERAAVIELLRRRCISFGEALREELDQDIDAWDRSSRAARLVSGLAEWGELLELQAQLSSGEEEAAPDEAEARRRGDERLASIRNLVTIVEGLDADRKLWMQARTHDEHAAFLRELLERRLLPQSERRAAVEGIIEEVAIAGCVREAAGTPPVVGVEQVVKLVQSMAGRCAVDIHGQDKGGVRVLDCMRARGLSHRAVIWMGFQDGSFPFQTHADSYLDDEVRSGISSSCGKALSVKAEAGDEERLLLAMTLAGARERLILCFQRADEDGKKLARSSALREVARVFMGQPDAGLLLDGAEGNPWRPEQVPAHPGERAAFLAASPRLGFVPPSDVVIGATVRAKDSVGCARGALEALEQLDENATATLDYVQAVEKFDPGDARFDGKTEIGIDRARVYSPTSIERLAHCPQSFFLKDVLGVREIDDEALPHRIEKRILGNAAHATLAAFYEGLAKKGRLAEGDPGQASDFLGKLWRKELKSRAGPSYKRLRGFFTILGDQWLVALRDFVDRDIKDLQKTLQEEATFHLQTEQKVEARLRVGELELPLRGHLDRILRFQDRVWVDDYKTGKNLKKNLKKKLAPKDLLTGASLQLPLYREIVAHVEGVKPQDVRARLLGVGPDAEEAEAKLDISAEVREGFLESVGVSLKLARQGFFPLHPDPSDFSYCSYCNYRRTCRRTHEPTLRRLADSPPLQDYRDVREKKSNNRVQLRTLAEVRAQRSDSRDASQEKGGSA